MTRKWKSHIATAICAIAGGRVWAQAPRVVTLDIEFENAVVYGDILDLSKYATSPEPTNPGAPPKNFGLFIVFGDIVSVNGKPAKGAFVDNGRVVALLRSPAPG